MCFSLSWVENILIYLVIVCAIVALLRLVLPFILAQLGTGGATVMAAINIVIWAIITIAVIIFIFDLIFCIAPGGLSFPRAR